MRVAAGGCGSDASGVAGEGGPIMSRSRVRIGFAALTCSPDTDHSEEPMRPGRFAARCSLALSLLVAMALGFVSAAGAADPVPNPAVSGPIEGGVHGYPWNHSLFALRGPGYDYTEQEFFFSGHPAEEELLLRVVVARPAEREQRVVPRIAVDSALDGAGDRGIGHGIGRAGRRDKTERHRDEQRESEGTTGGEPPGTHGLLRVVRVGGTSQRREPDAYARARHDGASFSGNPACVGPASTCRHPHTNLAAMPALWTNEDSIAQSTARAPSRGLARVIHVSARISGGFVVAVTGFRPSSTRATVMQASSESLESVRPQGRDIAHPGGCDYPLRDRARPSLCVGNPAGARWTGGPAPGYASLLCVRAPSTLVRGQICRARRSPGPRPRRDSCAGRSSAFSSPECSSPSRPPSPAARRRACGPRSAAPSTASPTSWPTTGRAWGSAPGTRSPRTTSARSPRRTSRSTGNGPGSSARMGATSRRRWGSASTTWIPTCSSGRSSTRTSSTGCWPSCRRSDRSPPSSRTSRDTPRATTGT